MLIQLIYGYRCEEANPTNLLRAIVVADGLVSKWR